MYLLGFLWESVMHVCQLKVFIRRHSNCQGYAYNLLQTLPVCLPTQKSLFGCKPVGLQPVGILPELHYVIHVCPSGFVCALNAAHARNCSLAVISSKSMYQYPIALAWAVIMVMPHKVQGTSLDKAVIDLGSDIFNHGQAYIALSKVRTLEGVC